MTQLLEVIETERRLTEEEWERVNARFEERLALFDDMVEKAKLITGDAPPVEKPKAKPGPKPKKPKAGNPNRVKTGHFDKLPQGSHDERKAKVLATLQEAHPEQLRSKELQKAVGPTSASGIRPLLEELLEEGKIVKSGQRAGTRYGVIKAGETSAPAGAPESFDPVADQHTIYEFLNEQSHPQSAPLIALKTKIPATRTAGALNRLINQRVVHRVRVGAGDAFELAGAR
jgi:hypothetical protein